MFTLAKRRFTVSIIQLLCDKRINSASCNWGFFFGFQADLFTVFIPYDKVLTVSYNRLSIIHRYQVRKLHADI